jgi:glycerol kinase
MLLIDRDRKHKQWEEAVERSFGWTDVYKPADRI